MINSSNLADYKVVKFSTTEWEAYKTIRLEALQTNPAMFGSNYNKESAYTDQQWIGFLEMQGRAIFGLYADKDLVGLSAIAIKQEDPDTAVLYASYIQSLHRGQGLTRLFFKARLDWAKTKNCKYLQVSHRAGNTPSKSAILAFDFVFTHAEVATWPDGQVADELFYSRTC